ncbi:hypothetical protein Bca4012_071890 [Brassica carinata]
MVENYIGSLSEPFPIPLSCHLLNQILNAAFKVPGQLQSFLLPAIFKEFSSQSSLKISLQGNVYILSRNGIKKRIWECCQKLFSVGSIERKDAYSVLYLCLSSGSWTDGTESYKKSGVRKGVVTDSSEGCKIGRMERLMLRSHNPHLRYKREKRIQILMRENKHGAPPIAVIERGKEMDHACQTAAEYVFASSSERKQRLLFWVLKQMNMLVQKKVDEYVAMFSDIANEI